MERDSCGARLRHSCKAAEEREILTLRSVGIVRSMRRIWSHRDTVKRNATLLKADVVVVIRACLLPLLHDLEDAILDPSTSDLGDGVVLVVFLAALLASELRKIPRFGFILQKVALEPREVSLVVE